MTEITLSECPLWLIAVVAGGFALLAIAIVGLISTALVM